VDDIFDRATFLKQALVDFVLDAEGDLATALESYSAFQLAQVAQSPAQNLMPYEGVVESFLIAGRVGDQTPLDLFLAQASQLTERDRQIMQQWHRSFPGIFAVVQVLSNGLELMNWLTAKHYQVRFIDHKLTPGEILLTFITPVTEQQWICSKPLLLGKLGKPKLAVAIGNFKQCYGNYLYSDAPDLLAEAWRSVERYHQDFVDFFGTDELTLPGYQWTKQLTAFQEFLTQRQLEAAGIDSSKTLQQLAEEAGLPDDELAEIEQVAPLSDRSSPNKMVAPQVELPGALKKAENVTALTHPRWGQSFFSTYWQLKTLLEAPQLSPNAETLIQQSLNDPHIHAQIWHRLAQQYPQSLEQALRVGLSRPNFQLKADLDPLLQELNKPLEPLLPEIASVPLHLHELFQQALLEVSKDKSKSKVKRKSAMGFQS
jgi:hypothetical protein